MEWTERPFLRQWVQFHFIGSPFVRRWGWGCSLIRGVSSIRTRPASLGFYSHQEPSGAGGRREGMWAPFAFLGGLQIVNEIALDRTAFSSYPLFAAWLYYRTVASWAFF